MGGSWGRREEIGVAHKLGAWGRNQSPSLVCLPAIFAIVTTFEELVFRVFSWDKNFVALSPAVGLASTFLRFIIIGFAEFPLLECITIGL